MIEKTTATRLFLMLVLLLGAATAGWAQSSPWKPVMQLPAADGDRRLDQPLALEVDAEKQRYYVVDAGAGQLDSFDATGRHVASFDGGGRLKTPVAMARTSTGKFWVVERSANQILHVDLQQKKIRDFSLRYPDSGPMFIDRIVVDGDDRLFVLDRLRGAVLRIDDNLKIVRTFAAPAGSSGLCDFKVKPDGIWALDCLGRKVYRFDGEGTLVETIALNRDLLFPVALEVEAADRIYVLDRHNGTVNVFDRQGRFKFDFLGAGKGRGQLWYGSFLRFDWENRLCVVDEGNGKVEIFVRQ